MVENREEQKSHVKENINYIFCKESFVEEWCMNDEHDILSDILKLHNLIDHISSAFLY